MKLVLLYGPPAVGKLTIANELSKITGIKIFHNHMFLNPLSDIFGYENPVRRKLEHEIRLRVIEEAAKDNFDLIVTGGIMRDNSDFYNNMIKTVKQEAGDCFLVQLSADRQVLMKHVVGESRVKANKLPLEPERLEEFLNKYPESLEKFGEGEQLQIDTSNTEPTEAAKKIAEHYHLI